MYAYIYLIICERRVSVRPIDTLTTFDQKLLIVTVYKVFSRSTRGTASLSLTDSGRPTNHHPRVLCIFVVSRYGEISFRARFLCFYRRRKSARAFSAPRRIHNAGECVRASARASAGAFIALQRASGGPRGGDPRVSRTYIYGRKNILS